MPGQALQLPHLHEVEQVSFVALVVLVQGLDGGIHLPGAGQGQGLAQLGVVAAEGGAAGQGQRSEGQ